jgi:hypothetical protein
MYIGLAKYIYIYTIDMDECGGKWYQKKPKVKNLNAILIEVI